jgi:hypothetical protein
MKIQDLFEVNDKRGKKVAESLNVLSQWKNDEPAGYVKQLVKFFKNPDELTHKRAIWYNKDGFKRIEVLDEYILHSSPLPHYDYVYSYVDLRVPHDLSDDLAKSSESILIDHLKGEVGARCASLSANAVTIQYVLDVVENNVKPSKAEYEKRIKSMKKMFADGKRFELDWWPDVTGDTDPKNPYYKESKLNNNNPVYEDSKSKKQVKENTENWREDIEINDIVKIEKRYYVVDKFSQSRYGRGLFFRRIDSVIYHKTFDEYQFIGPSTNFYTFNDFNKDSSINFVMKHSDPKYQEFLTKQGRLTIRENEFFKEDDRIVKGVNTNVDIIDNKNGWGAVPNNQEVDYLGLRVTMTPKHFIDLAAPLDGEPSEKIAQHLEQGGTIGSPFLRIEIPESWENGDFSMPARVVGHEGRNRMAAIAKVFGNNPVETHLFFSQGLRNRHITDEFKKNLNRGLVKEKSKSIIQGPFFKLNESNTNVLFNIGLFESINPELLNKDFHKETVVDTKIGKVKIVANHYPSNMIPQIKVEAFIDNKSIGYVRFIVIGNDEPSGLFKRFKKADPYLVAGNLRVNDEYQRNGIATAMYKFVKSMGNDIKPSTSQTSQGKAFWTSNPNESVEPKYSLREWAAMQGGHAVEEIPKKRKPFDWNKY